VDECELLYSIAEIFKTLSNLYKMKYGARFEKDGIMAYIYGRLQQN
jgi:hypothetical protein